MDRELKACEVCGKTDGRIYSNKNKFNKALCVKHYTQMLNYGKIVDKEIEKRKISENTTCSYCSSKNIRYRKKYGRFICEKHLAQLKRHGKIMDDEYEKIKQEKSIENIGSDVIDMYLSGMTSSEVARQFNVSDDTVRKMLIESNDDIVLERYYANTPNRSIRSKVIVENDIIIVYPSNERYKEEPFYFSYNKELNNRLMATNWCKNREDGYLTGNLDNKTISAHRLAYSLYHSCDISNEIIDHKDRDTHNNTIENLRFTNNNLNRVNAKINSNNKTGYTGVCLRKSTGKYRAYIYKDSKYIELGTYSTPEEAYLVRAKTELGMYGDHANIHVDFKYLLKEKVNNNV